MANVYRKSNHKLLGVYMSTYHGNYCNVYHYKIAGQLDEIGVIRAEDAYVDTEVHLGTLFGTNFGLESEREYQERIRREAKAFRHAANYGVGVGQFLYTSNHQIDFSETEKRIMQLTTKKTMEKKTWSFKASSDYLIDYDKIASELSYKNPVALVKRGKAVSSILIHKTIIDKARALGYRLANVKELTCTSYAVVKKNKALGYFPMENVGEWLEWVKEVKAAKHVGVYVKEQTRVTVEIPL